MTGSAIAVERLHLPVNATSDGGHRLKTFAVLLDSVISVSNRTLVDLGAGPCLFAQVAIERGYATTAVDARTVRKPKDLGGITFIQADVRDFDPTGFGVVAMLGLLYHLDIPDQFALLRRCAYGAPVIVETQVHEPAFATPARPEPWHAVIQRDGYEGVEFPENNTAMASVGNAISFWHTEASLIRLFADAGYERVTLIDPMFRSQFGARRFYLLNPRA
jgi:hypothetical protein